eukprot:CAMPEP_0198220750 /NCGR_PEP_ID=MMETSP1445-20131203/80533_1 /TAXON_ID=36898 /ORGANISM="Pyramimonas sp., Strain CCMP2087" /LENGTH=49 /DNA_ID= /DNA_START= /DNA_END= /DNA_ORIENTATION=
MIVGARVTQPPIQADHLGALQEDDEEKEEGVIEDSVLPSPKQASSLHRT